MLDAVGNAPLGGLHASIDSVSNRAALHKDDGMMPILARDGRGQAEHILRLGASRHQLKARCRKVVALVNDQVAVIGNQIGHLTSTHKALDQRDIYDARRLASAASDDSDFLRIDVEECFETLNPLGEQFAAMDENQGIAPARR